MTSTYNRSEVISWHELSEKQKNDLLRSYDLGVIEDSNFVLFTEKDGTDTALPLFNFMRTNRKFTHGIYGLTAYSCYTVTLSKSNDCAVVAYKYF